MKKFIRKSLITIVLTLLLLEVVLRIFGTDEGHRLVVFGMSIQKGYDLKHWQEVYAPYSNANFWESDTVYGGFHKAHGWTILPKRTSRGGLYQSNGQGLQPKK